MFQLFFLLLLINLLLKVVEAQQIGVVTVAGQWSAGYADGQGTLAVFSFPTGIGILKSTNTIFVSDYALHRIRKITVDGLVSTFAGSGTAGFLDGRGTAASFYNPRGIAIDSTANLYVTDVSNHRMRKIDPTGLVSTVAGNGVAAYLDGQGVNAHYHGQLELVCCLQAQVMFTFRIWVEANVFGRYLPPVW